MTELAEGVAHACLKVGRGRRSDRTGDRSPPPRSPSIRVLFVSDSIRQPLTGVGRVALTLLREWRAAGVELIGIDHEDNPTIRALADRFVVLPIRGRWRMGRWHLTLLRRLGHLGLPDGVLFDPTGYPNAFGTHRAEVVLVHDMSMFHRDHSRIAKRAWFRTFYPRALRRAHLCVCVSEYARTELLGRVRLAEDRCVVVPNGLDPDFATAPRGAPPATMPRQPFFLTVGTIEPRKNTARLLSAFAAAGPGPDLVFVGRKGPGASALFAAAAGPTSSLRDRVHVLSGIDDDGLRHLYRHATALLFPSLEEGFGLPILEAMQSDLPVLTSTVTAMPEVAGEAALLVDPLDVDAIRDGICRLAQDASLRERLVEAGRRRIGRFTARACAAQLLEHLQRVDAKSS